MSEVVAKSIAVTPTTHRSLTVLADDDHRTMAGEMAWLVEKELAARGYDPETLVKSDEPPSGK